MNAVKVAVRLKPHKSSPSSSSRDPPRISYSIGDSPSAPSIFIQKGNQSKEFTFDHVYDEEANNADIFDTSIQSLIAECFNGFNTTIFAYGQSGSGKTFTMGTTTAALNTSSEGMIPRSLKYIFNRVNQLTDDNNDSDKMNSTSSCKTYKITASFIEIYNDEFIDLLNVGNESKEIQIREDNGNHIIVSGMRECVLQSESDAFQVLEIGNSARSTASTLMNDVSSRSHAIFSLNMVITAESMTGDGKPSSVTQSKLHLVDLAGSERSKKTGAVGVRLKESVGINQGLMSLGRVIRTLTSGKNHAHIPYRESKLTRFLQDSLGGNSRTLMVACISTASENLGETLSTLEYASKARLIHNRPVVNVHASDDGRSLVDSLRAQILAMQQTSLEAAVEQLPVNRGRDEFEYVAVCLAKVRPSVQSLASQLSSDAVHRIDTEAVREVVQALSRYYSSQSMEEDEGDIVSRLQRELDECRGDLDRDEELYALKVDELRTMKQRLSKAEKEIEGLRGRLSSVVGVADVCGVSRPDSARIDYTELRALLERRDALRAERRRLEERYYEAMEEIEGDAKTALSDLEQRLDDIRYRLKHKLDIESNRAIIQVNSERLGRTYDGRMMELEDERDVIRKHLDDVIGDSAAQQDLQKRLERTDDELEILRIRSEQQRKGFDDAIAAESLKLDAEDDDGEDSNWLRHEESRLLKCFEDEARDLRIHEADAAEIEKRLKEVIKEASSVETALGAYSDADIALCGSCSSSLLRRHADHIDAIYKKNRKQLKQFMVLVDEAVAVKRVSSNEKDIEILQRQLESSQLRKETLESRLAYDSIANKMRDDLLIEINEATAMQDLIKISLIEASRSPRGKSGNQLRLSTDVESLSKAVKGLDSDICRDLAILLSEVLIDTVLDKQAHDAGALRQHSEEKKLLQSVMKNMQEEHASEIRLIRSEYEEKVQYLLQQMRLSEDKLRTLRLRKSSSNSETSPSTDDSSKESIASRIGPGSLAPTPGSKQSTPRRPDLTVDVDMGKVVSRWKAEVKRRNQLEKRNSELLKEIRELKYNV